ncbi:glycosyltransferase, partial [Cryobacterium sp. MLB-32]|uniref:glycosyltransferase family 4 protein n=1 Tax=Cryobacterium sp. MLB-32 TaxID=1529318 RepID=UPI000690B9E7
MARPRIVQHSFGTVGSGGPIGTLTRVLASGLGDSFEFRHVAQPGAAGGINLRLLSSMARQMREFHPQLAHIRGLGNEGFHGVLAARLAGVPTILVSVHGSVRDLVHGPVGLRRWIVGWVLEPLTLRLATHVVVVCEDALAKPVLRPVRRKIVGVVPNGVDLPDAGPAATATDAGESADAGPAATATDAGESADAGPAATASDTGESADADPAATSRAGLRGQLAIGVDDLVLIVVGRLVLDKGYLDLLDALDRLPPGGAAVHVLVVGDGPDAAVIRERAASVSRVHVHLLGRRLDVPVLLSAADVFVLPSLHENMSNALLEAMAAGLPVVATRVGGSTEVVGHGGGLLVPPHDPAALAAALQQLFDDPALRSRLGREARAVVAARYTTARMTARLTAVYTALLGRSAPVQKPRDSVALLGRSAPVQQPRDSVVLLGFTIDDRLFGEIAERSSVLPTQTHNFAWNLVRALRSAGLSVSLLSALPVPNYPEYPQIVVRSRRIGARTASGETLGFVNLLVLKHVTRLYSCLVHGTRFVRRQAPAVVVVHGIHTPFLLFARLLRRTLPVTICLVMTDPPGVVRSVDGPVARVLKGLDRQLVRRLAQGFDGIVALTPALAEDFAPGVPRLVVEGFVDPGLHDVVPALTTGTGEIHVAYAGGITADYGVGNLVNAFRSLPDPRLRLDLYGRGTLDAWVRARCDTDARITHHGVLAHRELMPALRAAQLLVNPRPAAQDFVKYSFPSKLLEYLALGVPVVTTRLAGIPDDYLPYLQLTADDSVAALADAIESTLGDPEGAAERADRARRYVFATKSTGVEGQRIARFIAGLGGAADAATRA